MSAVAALPEELLRRARERRRSVALVFCCTLFGAAAQILIKTGANALPHPGVVDMLTNIHLLGGYALYGLSTILLVMALRDGELSLLYPVISLTYVWVTLLSVALLHESVNLFKAIGVAAIVFGVGVLGRDNRS